MVHFQTECHPPTLTENKAEFVSYLHFLLHICYLPNRINFKVR